MTGPDPLANRDVAVAAIEQLLAELRGQNDWENPTLERYLEALGALLGSIENHYANTGQVLPSDAWTILADVLKGARYYE